MATIYQPINPVKQRDCVIVMRSRLTQPMPSGAGWQTEVGLLYSNARYIIPIIMIMLCSLRI